MYSSDIERDVGGLVESAPPLVALLPPVDDDAVVPGLLMSARCCYCSYFWWPRLVAFVAVLVPQTVANV